MLRNNKLEESHLLEWLLTKIEKITSVGKAVEKRGPLCTVGGDIN